MIPELTSTTLDQIKFDLKMLLPELEKKFDLLNIHDETSCAEALDVVLRLRQYIKHIETCRKETTRPIVDYKKQIDSIYMEASEQTDYIYTKVTEKIEKFVSTKPQLTSIKTNLGSMSVKNKFFFKIENEQLIPREFLQVDDIAIEKAIKCGLREIPGVWIEEYKDVQFRLTNNKDDSDLFDV